jgi:hypothetical protein
MPTGAKHLIKCRCVMPQFKNLHEPPAHQFVVFSAIDELDQVQPKFAQCNNCGVIHKVIDICKSEILMNKEDMGSILKIDDIKPGLPPNLSKILEINDVDLPTWEAANFIIENKKWGEFVVLTSDMEHGTRHGKYVQILGENLFKVNTFSREEIAKR